MAKAKNKQNNTTVNRKVEQEVEEIKILNEATEDQMIEIDTSALDEELRNTEGAALVMPIRGGNSDKSKKKDKNKDKSDKAKSKDKKEESISSIFSKFLNGEADVNDVKVDSYEDLEDAINNEDLIALGKFLKSQPGILVDYFKNKHNKASEDIKDVTVDYFEDDEDKKANSDADLNQELNNKIDLDQEERDEIREKISEFMEKLDENVAVKPLFKTIKKELGVNIVSIINDLLDNLEDYDIDKFNEFIKEAVSKIEESKLGKFIKYFTNQDSTISIFEFLFNSNKEDCIRITENVKDNIKKIMDDSSMKYVLAKEYDEDSELFKELTKTFIKVTDRKIKELEERTLLLPAPSEETQTNNTQTHTNKDNEYEPRIISSSQQFFDKLNGLLK